MLTDKKFGVKHVFITFAIFCYLQSFIGIAFSIWNVFNVLGWGLAFSMVIFMGSYCRFNRKNIILFVVILTGQMIGFIYSMQTAYPNKHVYKAGEFILCYLLMGVIPQYVVLKKKDIERMLLFMIGVALVSCAYAIVFQLGKGVFSFRDSNNFSIANIYVSFWGHRNVFALVLIGAMISAAYFRQYKKYKLISSIIFVFLGINLVLTLSRAAYLAIFVFVLSYLLCEWKNHKIEVGFLFLIGVFLICLYIYSPTIKSIVDTYMIRKSSGSTGRDTLWNKAFELMDIPTIICGRSIGSEQVILKGDYISQGAGFHNVYIAYMIEGGLMLLLPLFIQILSVFYNVKKNLKEKHRNVFDWSIATMLAFLVYPLFETSKYFNMGVGPFVQTYFVFTSQWLLINTYKEIDHKQ